MMKAQLWKHILNVRNNSPLVHNITNYVVMNNTANALLAAGASPVMAHAHPETAGMVAIAGAVVINIGTLDAYWVQSMRLAIAAANALGRPWVLDPVGAGATAYRDEVLAELILLKPAVIRGNASEIMALAKHSLGTTKGVDSTEQSTAAVDAAEMLHKATGSIICISGETDIVLSGSQKIYLSNGSPLMSRVTGLGCSATALIGAFVATAPNDPLHATAAAMALLSIAGELAAEISAGPGSLQLHLLDKLYTLSEEEFHHHLKAVLR